ncbi:14301_t:CDS:2 [Gigaspora margarita]|uniref:14301_t:CDS:1 n=1 Tax=Gigaspora margarita TaxID=4874 RepID=A0ABM8W4M2_GIGMA|nr:14301_t:CDS:2 [Gigaspora margarita]
MILLIKNNAIIIETSKNLYKSLSQVFENLQFDSESDQVTDLESKITQRLIWNYYNKDVDPVTNIKTGICKVIVKKGNKVVKCKKEKLYNEQRDAQNNSVIETISANINKDNHFQTMLFNMILSCNSELETDEFSSYQQLTELYSK